MCYAQKYRREKSMVEEKDILKEFKNNWITILLKNMCYIKSKGVNFQELFNLIYSLDTSDILKKLYN